MPRKELERASEALAAMKSAKSLAEFDDHWKQFLHRIERAWNKATAHYGRSPKWHGWVSPIERDRRIDPLLSYLINARGADEHTTSEITATQPGGVGIGLADGVGVDASGTLHIEHLTIISKPGEVEIQSAQPLKLTFFPERIRMEPVTNRGRLYPIPVSHKGQPINTEDLPSIAALALGYYDSSLAKAEAFFVK